MTLETARHYRPAEIQRHVSIARTIYPARHFRPVRHRQLKELIAFAPVEICLALASRANHEVEALGDGDGVRRCAENAGLKESITASIHSVLKLALRRLEDVFAGRETTGDRSRVCFA